MVIPVHDVNPVRRAPVVTYVLILVNIVVFLLSPVALSWLDGTSAADSCRAQAFYEEWGAVPEELISNDPRPLVVDGQVGQDAAGRVGCIVAQPDYVKMPVLSALTAMFLHGGWAHLLGNMLCLYVFGNNVEDRFGRLRYLLFYLLCGYAATYGFALLQPNSETPLVGASGAIAGVLGAYLAMFPRARVWSLVPIFFFIPLRLPAWLVLGLWFLIQWWYSVGGGIAVANAGVAYVAHVIGFVVGLVVGAVVGPPKPPRPLPVYRPPPTGWPPYASR